MGDDEVDDETLGAAAAAGDRDALESLLERHQGELHAFVRLRFGRLIANRESTVDVVQSVCREVLEHGDRFQHAGDGGFRRWLFTTALRKIKNRRSYYLAAKRDVLKEIPPPADDGDLEGLMQHYATFSTPSRAYSLREEVERVEAAFEVLSDDQREILTLAHLGGLSRAEIAEQLGKEEGTVRVTLHRAIAKISALLDKEES